MLGATRRAPPRLPGLTEHQRHDARRRNITGAWTWEQAAWLSTPRPWLSQNHVPLDVPTTWPRSTSEKVPPWMTTTAWWPPGGDRQSRVRAGLSLLRVLPAALVAWPGCLEAAWGTLELRVERRSKVAMGPSACGCMRMVAELLLGHQSPWMLPKSIPGVLFHSGGLVGPPWVPKDVHSRVWVIGPHTHRGGGGVYIGRGAVQHHQKLFSCGFLGHTLLNRCRPDLGTLKTTCHRLR